MFGMLNKGVADNAGRTVQLIQDLIEDLNRFLENDTVHDDGKKRLGQDHVGAIANVPRRLWFGPLDAGSASRLALAHQTHGPELRVRWPRSALPIGPPRLQTGPASTQ